MVFCSPCLVDEPADKKKQTPYIHMYILKCHHLRSKYLSGCSLIIRPKQKAPTHTHTHTQGAPALFFKKNKKTFVLGCRCCMSYTVHILMRLIRHSNLPNLGQLTKDDIASATEISFLHSQGSAVSQLSTEDDENFFSSLCIV